MDAIGKLLEHLGYGTSFIYAAAAFGLFYWLDENASDEAKTALASTMRLNRFNDEEIASALVETFDRLYSYPLFRWRAFLRTLTFTLIITIFTVIELFGIGQVRQTFANSGYSASIPAALLALVINVLFDYLALFVVRDWLTWCRFAPVFSLSIGTILAISIVILGMFARGLILFASGYLENDTLTLILFGALSLPAFAVFGWLPIFAIGIAVIRMISPLSWMIGRTQWFLKDGKEHPLKAIGYVAAMVVFVGAVSWQAAR
jgi:hypothetical protein